MKKFSFGQVKYQAGRFTHQAGRLPFIRRFTGPSLRARIHRRMILAVINVAIGVSAAFWWARNPAASESIVATLGFYYICVGAWGVYNCVKVLRSPVFYLAAIKQTSTSNREDARL